ncbi:sas10/Utp3/C1D family [Artemisia annua]|uniref:Sas10/Utp3/C1D family n=1 Tax=Artemisia annua TaxID=35608 RepID=A0A2U1MS38_ARTAN|nr:sas10/Utp3/C1D family [Artemisia annua]
MAFTCIFLLRKAKGLPIQGHPLVHSLLETRLFLEKIRPIDKKLQYQIQKLTRVTENPADGVGSDDKKSHEADDSLKLRPNPDMLITKFGPEDGDGVYRPPKIVPASMDETKTSKQERNASRKEKQAFRQALQNVTRYKAKLEDRARREEELFTRAPLSSVEKKQLKHMRKPGCGLSGLADSFYDDIKSLPLEDGAGGPETPFLDSDGGERKFKRRKRRH